MMSWKLLGIKWHHHVQNDEVRRIAGQPHLSVIVQAWYFYLFSHIAWMPDKTDAKKILTPSPRRTGGDHLDTLIPRRWRLSSKIWNPITSPWMKQLAWLRIVHCGDWCLHLVYARKEEAFCDSLIVGLFSTSLARTSFCGTGFGSKLLLIGFLCFSF